ncbi:MAG: hypothetical protein RLZZ46_906 [Bacteroidota bacterium]
MWITWTRFFRFPLPVSELRILMRWFCFLVLHVLLMRCWQPAFSQKKYPQDIFLNPLNIPISLSGNFGEIRNNHFHSGLDIRTGGKEGLPVMASAAGYISRIKVSPFGYGKAIYLNHGNGYVSVYAHLSAFDSLVTAWVHRQQYERQTFELDLFPPKNMFSYAQCDTIGLSGNTGGSEGPHLHFEIRDEKTEMPLNPMLFGLPVEDILPPVIASVLVSPTEEGQTVNGSLRPVRLKVKPSPSSLLRQGVDGITDTVVSEGMLNFAVETWDCETSEESKNGVFSLEMLAEGTTVFATEMERFSFDNTKFVNAHIDYHERKVHKRTYIRTHFLPNNKAGVYLQAARGFAAAPEPGELRLMEFRAADVTGKRFLVQLPWMGISVPSSLSLPASEEDDSLTAELKNSDEAKFWEWNHDHWYESPELHVSVNAGALYDDINFKCSKVKAPSGARSPAYQIFREDVPLHKSAIVEIKAAKIPAGLQNKVVLARIDQKGKVQNASAATHIKGWYQAKISQFGRYTLMIDSLPPAIARKNMKNGKPGIKDDFLLFHISDKLSGIDKYRGSIDGKWVLMEYDAKSGLLRYNFDQYLEKNGKKHTFLLLVTDHSGNKKIEKLSFVY